MGIAARELILDLVSFIVIHAAQIPEHVDEQVVVDGNTITSQGPATAMIFSLKVRVFLRGWD